jgi:uncharacterized membrane protein
MHARFRKTAQDLLNAFWVLPAVLVLVGIAGSIGTVVLDRREAVPSWLVERWLYGGGDNGARALLGAIASSTIGVAGTVFSITVAALTLASNQMGPRLLRNFMRDRGNQATLGVFLGTFAYALVALRTVRGEDEGGFIPHLTLTIGSLLAFGCIGMLIYFVHHVASRINVDTVIDLVYADLRHAIATLTVEAPQPDPPSGHPWCHGMPIAEQGGGYLQQLDEDGLADWAAERGTTVRLLTRTGDFVFPGVPVALVRPPTEGAEAAVRGATALGPHRVLAGDLESAVRQLVEVAVRALSPGINDPQTAMSVVERLGSALCETAPRHLPTGVVLRDGNPVLVRNATDYGGLTDAMFHTIRQNAAGTAPVLIRMLEVLTAVARCERRPERLAALQRHAGLILADGRRSVPNTSDRADLVNRHRRFLDVVRDGPLAGIGADFPSA